MAGFHKIRNTEGRTIYPKIHTYCVINNYLAYFIMYRMFNMFLYSFMYSSFKDNQLNSNNLFSSFENKIRSLLVYSDRYVYNITGQL